MNGAIKKCPTGWRINGPKMPLSNTSNLGLGSSKLDFPTERKKGVFFYSCDKTLWLSRSGWPQVPLIPGRPRSVCGWLICVFLSVCLLSTKVLKPLQHFTVQSFPADTTFISVKSRVRSCEYKWAVQKKYMTCLIEVVPESTVLPPGVIPETGTCLLGSFFLINAALLSDWIHKETDEKSGRR